MNNSVIIIESPNKIKKIQEITRAKVFATCGHFMDLKHIEVEKSFNPMFDYKSTDKKQSINRIINECKNKVVYIATDPDREGYAIGYMFYQLIKNLAKEIYRAEFHEITESGINKGLKTALLFSQSNMKFYDSFLARRVADMYMGYTLSPYLAKGLNQYPQSAGRVKTPALYLIVKRALEIENFEKLDIKDKMSYQIQAKVLLNNNEVILKHIKDNKEFKFDNKEQAQSFLDDLKQGLGDKVLLNNIETKDTESSPPKPFTTSKLLKSASKNLKLDTKTIQNLAQNLFEAGLITYIRTDSEALSKEYLQEHKNFFEKLYPSVYEYREYKAGKNSQAEAHEAIRITHPHAFENIHQVCNEHNITDSKAIGLYQLIFINTLASQSKNALYESVSMHFKIKMHDFKCSFKNLKFKGFLEILELDKNKPEDQEEEEKELSLNLKDFSPNTLHPLKELFIKDILKTSPKPYLESDFIEVMEKNGIGRPSTYASYLPELISKGHIQINGNKRVIEPTALGKGIVEFFNKDTKSMFILNVDFTKQNEEVLDKIAMGEVGYVEFMELIKEKLGDEISSLYKGIKRENNSENTAKTYQAYPPNEKQLQYAKDIANLLNLKLPKDLEKNYKICSEFIDKYKQQAYKARFKN
ncbi:type IA DNA topoisomerase [Helicobacter cetorum]|uniref:DNA topoisomerase n=1 Tax=Helicobacter cetorum (strain ATCC BAA-429 / MIT 00-7128) TaxID=182217 RepID=I0EMG6_HELC0|nr:type IA DNA topoisomerase [Helicobacter cetorum]AFI04135.1 topoisomerase I [Helicobacter cetorum MIT 00-7128]